MAELMLVGYRARGALVERVRVVESAPVRSRRRENVVEERALYQVRVPILAGGQEESPAQHHGGDAFACLRVSPVGGQLEVVAECLVLVMGTDPASNVRAV